MVNFKEIKAYWKNKQPVRKIASNINENDNTKQFRWNHMINAIK